MAGSTIDLYDFGEGFATGNFPLMVRIAVVTKNAAKHDVELVLADARSRGFTMQIFDDVAGAMGWLQQGQRSPTKEAPP